MKHETGKQLLALRIQNAQIEGWDVRGEQSTPSHAPLRESTHDLLLLVESLPLCKLLLRMPHVILQFSHFAPHLPEKKRTVTRDRFLVESEKAKESKSEVYACIRIFRIAQHATVTVPAAHLV